jgi:hypothetical protein
MTSFPDPSAQLDVRLELCAGGTWTDGTSDCDHGPMTITRGHPDESTTVSPSTFSATLTNTTARYSPDNPMSDLWPWCLQNMPVRVSIPAPVNYLRLEPEVGQTPVAYVNDTSALHLTSSIEVRWAGRLTDWQGGVLGARVNGATPAWYWVLNGDGTMTLSWWDSGGTQHTVSSDAPLPFITSAFALKVTLDVSTGTVTFYSAATSIDGTYSQVGNARVSGATSLRAGVAALETGTTLSASYDLGQLCGSVTEVRLYSGIGGTLTADGQFSAQSAGTTSWTGTDGLSWLLSTDAEISDRRYRGHFEGSEWPQEEPEYNPDAGNDGSVETDALVPLVGGGLLRRLGQRAPEVASSLKRDLLALSGTLACVALWPCEDSAGATQLASAIPGVGAMTFISGMPLLAASQPFGSVSMPLPEINGSQWHGAVPSYTSAGHIVVRFLANITGTLPSGSGAWESLLRIVTTGTAKWVDMIVYSDSGNVGLVGYDSSATQIWISGEQEFNGGVDNQWFSMEAKITGGTVQWALAAIVPGTTTAEVYTTTLSGTVGEVTDIYVNPGTWPYTTMTAGMISVQSDWESVTSFTDYLSGHAGEPAGTRFVRLCGENLVPCRIRGNAADTVPMGSQAVDTLSNLLQTCANTDQGTWYEPREVLGWEYVTRKAMYNQPATATVSYTSDHLSPWTSPPTRDDQTVVNDVTMINDSGSSARQYAAPGQPIDGGRMSTLNPKDGGIGSYAQTYDVSAASDSDLANLAGWQLHVGTADQPRLPGIMIDLANQDAAGIYDDVLDLDLAGRLVITDPPRRLGFEPVSQLAQQLTETLWYDTLTVAVCGIPELPYEVLAGDTGMHLAPAAGAGALASGVNSTATSWSVAANSGDSTQLWSVNTADYPQDWVIDGERVTVSAVSGSTSPQTATVTRSVNGVVKSHLSGAAVTTWPPPVIGL